MWNFHLHRLASLGAVPLSLYFKDTSAGCVPAPHTQNTGGIQPRIFASFLIQYSFEVEALDANACGGICLGTIKLYFDILEYTAPARGRHSFGLYPSAKLIPVSNSLSSVGELYSIYFAHIFHNHPGLPFF
ncbi:unnamed protein product [Gordionus sp. m RMFG-2023]